MNDLKRIYEKKDAITVIPTTGKNTCKFKCRGVEYEFEDVGGSGHMKTYWSKYYRDTDAVVYVIDCSHDNEEHYRESLTELHQVLNHVDLIDAPVCICLNKMDLINDRCIVRSKESFESLYNSLWSTDIASMRGRSITVLETIFSTVREHEYWLKKRSVVRYGAQTQQQLDDEEEEQSKFELHLHKGAEAMVEFFEVSAKNDYNCRKRNAHNKKRRSSARR